MPTKTFISPSDLTFGWSNCHRCLWLKYNAGVTAPMMMPLVGTLSAMQESLYRNATTQELSRVLPPGRVVGAGDWVVSQPIFVNDEVTEFKVRGKYDLLTQFDSGSYGIVDCKVSSSENDKALFYQPQLEAYAFALEQPERGSAKQVSQMGLLVWAPERADGDVDRGYTFQMNAFWQPIARNPESLEELLGQFITVITQVTPPETQDGCRDCAYVASRHELGH